MDNEDKQFRRDTLIHRGLYVFVAVLVLLTGFVAFQAVSQQKAGAYEDDLSLPIFNIQAGNTKELILNDVKVSAE